MMIAYASSLPDAVSCPYCHRLGREHHLIHRLIYFDPKDAIPEVSRMVICPGSARKRLFG
jgi:hypothetical protein